MNFGGKQFAAPGGAAERYWISYSKGQVNARGSARRAGFRLGRPVFLWGSDFRSLLRTADEAQTSLVATGGFPLRECIKIDSEAKAGRGSISGVFVYTHYSPHPKIIVT
jgi:hypothetical protein